MRWSTFMAGAVIAAVVAAHGCLVGEVDYSDTQFSCRDGSCPDGFSCVDERCVAGDGGPGDGDGDDGGPGDGDGDGDGGDGDDGGPGDGDGGGGGTDAAPAAADAAAAATCDELFGAAPSYQLCEEQPDTCSFFVVIDEGAACEDTCGDFGADCVTAHDADPMASCRAMTEDGCAAVLQSQICICAR